MSLRTLIAVSVAALTSVNAYATGYPEKPVKIIVPYSPGGAVDVVARKVAQKLQEQTGQPFIIENKPGATGTIGTQAAVRSEPDGYTLLAIDNTYAVLPYVFKKLPWDHAKALTPITVAAFTPVVIAVRGDSPYKDLKSLVAEARANPDKLTYGTGGSGSAPHFSAEAFAMAANVQLMHVPYKGAGDAMTGLISSQIDMLFVSTPSVSSQIKGGKVKALAVSGDKRLDAFPTIPTFAEAGVPAFGIVNWSGLAAPAGTPDAVITRLHTEVKKALGSSDMKQFLASLSAEPGGMEPSAFSKLIRDETTRWEPVSKKANVERQ